MAATANLKLVTLFDLESQIQTGY